MNITDVKGSAYAVTSSPFAPPASLYLTSVYQGLLIDPLALYQRQERTG
ncbi:MAG TPA: hypothetical protein VE242_13190 [Chthoniobacterales bacterium]|nr:hypothetical protein [Chthoniobacterales bacterium]